MKFLLAGLSVASSLMFFANNADAFSYCNTPGSCDFAIAYEATDLPDATPGEDLWKYDYKFLNTTHADTFLADGSAASQSDSFHIGDYMFFVFDHSNEFKIDPPFFYNDISPFANSDWSFTLGGGGVDLGDFNKAVRFLPLVDDPSLAGLGATFVWNHSGTPGSQTFAFADKNTRWLTFDVYGDTTGGPAIYNGAAGVPEPSVMMLLGSGLAGFGLARLRLKGLFKR